MQTKDIPLIIPNFNQLTYLKNLINWWRWYYPENPVIVLDNASDYKPLLAWYKTILDYTEIRGPLSKTVSVYKYDKNDCAGNLRDFLTSELLTDYPYWVISDPDIMPHPATPPYFLEVFKYLIDHYNYHHAGFSLICEDIPDWVHDKDFIQTNERNFKNGGVPSGNIVLRNKNTGKLSRDLAGGQAQSMATRNPTLYEIVDPNTATNLFTFEYGGQELSGWRAPIDTTFALYTSNNGGWSTPMAPKDWDNSIRIFEAFHLGWYQHPDYINEEMQHYYKTARYWEPGEISAGINHNRPKEFIK